MGFANNTKFRLYNGEVKAIVDLEPGDKLMGWDSCPKTVISVKRGSGNLIAVERVGYYAYLVAEKYPICVIKQNENDVQFFNIPALPISEDLIDVTGVGTTLHFPYSKNASGAYKLGKKVGLRFYHDRTEIPEKIIASSLKSRLRFLIGMLDANENDITSNYSIKTLVKENFLELLELLRGLGMKYNISAKNLKGVSKDFYEYKAVIIDEDDRIEKKGKYNDPDGIYLIEQQLKLTKAGHGEWTQVLISDDDKMVQLEDGTVVLVS